MDIHYEIEYMFVYDYDYLRLYTTETFVWNYLWSLGVAIRRLTGRKS